MNRAAWLLSWGVMGSALAGEAPPPVDAGTPGEELPRFELGVQAGYASSRDQEGWDHAGAGLRVQGLVPLAAFFTLGAEASLHDEAGSRTLIMSGERPETTHASLFQLGGVMQLGGDLGRVRPFVQLGASWYEGVSTGLGYFAGAGLRVRLTPRWSLQGDARLDLRGLGGARPWPWARW